MSRLHEKRPPFVPMLMHDVDSGVLLDINGRWPKHPDELVHQVIVVESVDPGREDGGVKSDSEAFRKTATFHTFPAFDRFRHVHRDLKQYATRGSGVILRHEPIVTPVVVQVNVSRVQQDNANPMIVRINRLLKQSLNLELKNKDS